MWAVLRRRPRQPPLRSRQETWEHRVRCESQLICALGDIDFHMLSMQLHGDVEALLLPLGEQLVPASLP